MSKRKPTTAALEVDDLMFEDQDGNEDGITESPETSVIGGTGRVSGRVKKSKKVYDPSEHNGPVHKRKKEQLEAERAAKQQKKEKVQESPKKTASTDSVQKTTVIPVASPKKAAAAVPVVASGRAVKPTVKAVANRRQTIDNVSKPRLSLPKPPPGVDRGRKIPLIPVSPSKEPSKRIQQRKPEAIPLKVLSAPVTLINRQRPPSAVTTSTEYETASTVELHDREIPDVRQWSFQSVSDYFFKLGFSKADAAIFKDEEIDGETLMIMKREDIVSKKFNNLKLGTALKMWKHICSFQTGSNDPTQTWK